MKFAEEIVSISYIQSEKFSSVSIKNLAEIKKLYNFINIYYPFLYQAIFNQQQGSLMHLGKPKPSDRERVICGITRCSGVAVQVRTLAKNIRNVGTETIKCKH